MDAVRPYIRIGTRAHETVWVSQMGGNNVDRMKKFYFFATKLFCMFAMNCVPTALCVRILQRPLTLADEICTLLSTICDRFHSPMEHSLTILEAFLFDQKKLRSKSLKAAEEDVHF